MEQHQKFLIEKTIGAVEKKQPIRDQYGKTLKLCLKSNKNNKLCRRFYQSLFVDIADIFINYMHSLEPDEIKQLDDDIKANGWGVESVVDIQNSFELLCIFQDFYYLNCCLLLTYGLLPVLDGETSPGAKKCH